MNPLNILVALGILVIAAVAIRGVREDDLKMLVPKDESAQRAQESQRSQSTLEAAATPIAAAKEKDPSKMSASELQALVAEDHRKLQQQFAHADRIRFRGTVQQHLPAGELLVYGFTTAKGQHVATRSMYSLFDYPNSGSIADGTEIDCLTCVVGTYQYNAVSGANRTVYELLYTDHEAALDTSKPGAWMWDKNRDNPLNQPAWR